MKRVPAEVEVDEWERVYFPDARPLSEIEIAQLPAEVHRPLFRNDGPKRAQRRAAAAATPPAALPVEPTSSDRAASCEEQIRRWEALLATECSPAARLLGTNALARLYRELFDLLDELEGGDRGA